MDTPKMVNRLAVYISSFDGCSDLWGTFFYLFDCFWPDCAYPIFLINNEKNFTHKKAQVIRTGPEIHWFDRNIRALRQLDEKYIIFLLEDYLLSKTVTNSDVEEILDFMDQNDIFYYQLSVGNTKSKDPKRVNVTAETNYPISLQPAIWRRDELLHILEEINGKTPWDVEHYFVEKYKEKTGAIAGAYHDTRDLLGYVNGVLRGKWILDTLKYYKRLGISIDTGNREVMGKGKMLKYRVAAFVNRHVPTGVKNILKSFLSAMHFDYLK